MAQKDTKAEEAKAEVKEEAKQEAAVAAPAKTHIQNKTNHSVFISRKEGALFIKPGYPQLLEDVTIEELAETYPQVKKMVEAGTLVMLTDAEAAVEKKKIDIEFKRKYPKAAVAFRRA